MNIKRRLEALEITVSEQKCYSFVPIIDYLDGRIEISDIQKIEVPCPKGGVDLLDILGDKENEY